MPAAGVSEFPIFSDGDVKIVITGGRTYQLHSTILKNSSPVMRALLPVENSAKLTTKAIKRGVVIRYRLNVVAYPVIGADNTFSYVLEPTLLDSDGKASHHATVPLHLENGRVTPPILLAYNTILGAFYNVPVELGDFESDSMTEILTTAHHITDVAEYLQCIHLITMPIEATLLATGQLFYQAVVNNPVAWLFFAYRIRSRAIFREALVHAAGMYRMPEVQDELIHLPQPLKAVLQKKADALKEAMRYAEKRILSWYPTHLQREITVGRADKDSIGQGSYAKDIFAWMALTAFRHYFMENSNADQTHHAPDMGKEMVDLVMAGGDAYLPRPVLTNFHNLFPMSGKGDNVLEFKVSILKEGIKQFVQGLTKHESQLDIRKYPVKHFTCTYVSIQDYPWDTGYGPTPSQPDDSEEETEKDTEDEAQEEAEEEAEEEADEQVVEYTTDEAIRAEQMRDLEEVQNEGGGVEDSNDEVADDEMSDTEDDDAGVPLS